MSGGGPTYQAQVGTLAAGSDLFHQAVGFAHDKWNDQAAAFAKSHPIEYAVRAKFVDPSQVPGPINFSDPQSIAAGLQTNAAIVARVASREPGVSLSAIPEDQKPKVLSWMAAGPAQSGQAILDAIKALPPQARDATVSDPEGRRGPTIAARPAARPWRIRARGR